MSDKPITHDIKERLGKYTRLLREIDNQYERLGRMEISMAAPPGPDMTGMPRGSAEEREERAALEAMIRQVENPDERAVLRLRYFDRADWDGICAVLFSDRQDYLERIDSYQNRTYKAHGRALLRMAEILKETEAPAVKGSKIH